MALNDTLRYCPVRATEPAGRLAAILDMLHELHHPAAGYCRLGELGPINLSMTLMR